MRSTELNIKTQNNKKIIKFPVTLFYYFLFIIFLVGITPTFILVIINISVPVLLFFGVIFIFLFLLFILPFISRVTIDTEAKRITYSSIFKKTFSIEDIVSMENKDYYDSESIDTYSLIVRLCNNKKVEITTQSYEQRDLLRKEILKCRKTEPQQLLCKKCDTVLEASATYCSNCGLQIELPKR